MKNKVQRIDGPAKVMGKALYAADINIPGMLYVKVLRSDFPHAVIKDIKIKDNNLTKDLLILTAKDIPGIACQDMERPVLCKQKVRYTGDGIALIAAQHKETIDEVFKNIIVEYEPLKAVFDPREAIKKDSIKIHDKGNKIGQHKVRKGNVEEGFRNADYILEREYATSRVQHAAIEPEAAVSIMEGPQKIAIYCPSKSPFNVRKMVAETLGISYAQVRVVQTVMGGSFGGKDSDMGIMASRAALVTWYTGKPAKIVFSREESMIEGTKRHPYYLKYKIGVKNDGTIMAMKIDIIADAGAYKSKTPLVTWRSAVEAAGPYNVPNVETDIVAAFTNNPVSDALRGFGSPQVNFAIELLLDEVAEFLGIDPFEIRKNNSFSEGSTSATGQFLKDVSIRECLEKAYRTADWIRKRNYCEKYNSEKKSLKRGIGIACSFRGSALGAGGEGLDSAGAVVSIQRDGSIIVSCGIGEVGQGFQTVAARVVMEILGVSDKRIVVNPLDTNQIPDSGPTVASRGTVLGGSAIKLAAEKIKKTLAEVVAEKLGVPQEKLQFSDEKIYAPHSEKFSFDEAVKECFLQQKSLFGYGWYSAPQVWWDKEKGCGDAYFSYTYAADVAEVEVDIETGKVNVVNFIAVHDVGNAINPREVKGQICGGVAMGVGYALMEEVILRNGNNVNPNFDGYLIPTAMDTGKINPVIVEHSDRYGPFGARGLGEPATQIVAPAIVNAICHALGRRIYRIPVNLEDVFKISESTEESND